MNNGEMMKTFKEWLEEAIKGKAGSDTTQVATTRGTYVKSGEKLKTQIPDDGNVLNYGAGLHQTTDGLKEGLGGESSKHTVHDYEPFPEKRETPPTFTSSDEVPSNHYHAVVCHNVVNVLDKETREDVLNHMYHSVKEGGVIHIGARKFNGDIATAKNTTPGEEEKSVYVQRRTRNGTIPVYQKGWDGDELKRDIEEHAKRMGHTVEVTRVPGMAANGVSVRVIKKANNSGISEAKVSQTYLLNAKKHETAAKHHSEITSSCKPKSDKQNFHQLAAEAHKKAADAFSSGNTSEARGLAKSAEAATTRAQIADRS